MAIAYEGYETTSKTTYKGPDKPKPQPAPVPTPRPQQRQDPRNNPNYWRTPQTPQITNPQSWLVKMMNGIRSWANPSGQPGANSFNPVPRFQGMAPVNYYNGPNANAYSVTPGSRGNTGPTYNPAQDPRNNPNYWRSAPTSKYPAPAQTKLSSTPMPDRWVYNWLRGGYDAPSAAPQQTASTGWGGSGGWSDWGGGGGGGYSYKEPAPEWYMNLGRWSI